MKSYLPGFPAFAGCLPVAKVSSETGPLTWRSVQGDWAGGVIFLITKLPPLPIFLEVAPLSTATACTDFPLSLERCLLLLVVEFSVAPLSVLGLGSVSWSGFAVFSSGPLCHPTLPLLQQLLHTCLILLPHHLAIWHVSLSAAGVQCTVLICAGLLPLLHFPQTLQCSLLLQMPRSITICLHSWLLSLQRSLLSLHLPGVTDVLPLLLLLPLYVLICVVNVSVLIMIFHLDGCLSLHASSFSCPTTTCGLCLCEFHLSLISESIYTDCIHFQHLPAAPPLLNSFSANPPAAPSIAAPVPVHLQGVPPLLTSFSIAAPPVAAAAAHPQVLPPLFTSFSAAAHSVAAAAAHPQRASPLFTSFSVNSHPVAAPAPPPPASAPPPAAPALPQRASSLFTSFRVNTAPTPAHPQRAPPLLSTFSANPAPPVASSSAAPVHSTLTLPPASSVASGSAAPAAPAAASPRPTPALRFIAAPFPPPPSPPAAAFSPSPSPSPSPPPPDGFIFDLVPPDDVSLIFCAVV